MGRKLGAVPAFVFLPGELGPHLTQSRLGRGLPPYQVASLSIQMFGYTIDMGRKLGAVPPFWGVGELGPHLTQSYLV